MLKKQQAEAEVARVRGKTLGQAMSLAKRQYGSDVCLLDSREIPADGTHEAPERLFEIDVAASPVGGEQDVSPAVLIAREVERIESLVEELESRRAEQSATPIERPLDDFARILVHRGVSKSAARHLTNLREADTDVREEPILHLASLLRTAQGGWGVLGGGHLFLGRRGAGKSNLILGAAAQLHELGSKVLVVDLAPRHEGETRHLKRQALEVGYDAAVLRNPERLPEAAAQFADYDSVLMDAPDLDDPALENEALRQVLMDDETFQRHLVVPMDGDPAARESLWRLAKNWQCDWLSLSRLDLMEQTGRLIDHLLAAPYPVSLLSRGPWPARRPEIATSRRILEVVLRGADDEAQPAAARGTED